MTSRARIIVLIWALILIGGILYFTQYSRVVSDVSVFFPARSSVSFKKDFVLQQLRSGDASRLLIIALRGEDQQQLVRANRRLADRLKGHSLVEFVTNGSQGLTESELEYLFQNRYLFSPSLGADSFSPKTLGKEILQRLRDLSAPFPMLDKRRLVLDPTNEFLKYLSNLEGVATLWKRGGVWVSRDGKNSYLMVRMKENTFDIERFTDLIQEIRNDVRESAGSNGIKPDFYGSGMFALESRRIIQRESLQFSVLATLSLIALMYYFFRSVGVVLYSALPLVSAVVMAMAVTSAVFGSLHGITLAFGVILLGVCIDYPIHLFSHAGTGEQSPNRLKAVWPTILLGVLTSCLGFSVMAFSAFEGLSQLGIFAVTGLISASLVTRWVLPALPIQRMSVPLNHGLVRYVYISVSRLRIPIIGILASVLILFVWNQGYKQVFSVNELRQMSPVPVSMYEKEKKVRSELGLPDVNYLVVVKAKTAESVIGKTEQVLSQFEVLKRRGLLLHADGVSRYIPSQRLQTLNQKFLPDKDVLANALDQAVAGTPFKKGAFAAWPKEIARSKALAPVPVQTFLEQIKGGVLDYKVRSLLRQRNGEWISVVPLYGVKDVAAVENVVDQGGFVGVYFIDLKREIAGQVAGFRNDAILKTLVGIMAIYVILLFAKKSWTISLRVLLPVLSAMLLVVVILSQLGQALGIFHFVSLLLVLGIGIDYGLFFNRKGSLDEKMRTQYSLVACLFSSLLVFALMSFSEIPVLQAIGLTVSLGVLLSFLLTYLVAMSKKEI